jgi:hypothetical protein
MRPFMVVLLIIAPTYFSQEPTPVSPTADTMAQESPESSPSPQPLPPQSGELPAQSASPGASQPAPTYANDQQPPVPAANHRITLPPGTRIPLVLTNSIGRKLSQPGDSVRAATAFPVSIGDTLAIPLGTYVEGAIASFTRPSSSHQIGLEIHFTRLIFANGYAAEIPGATAQAQLENPNENFVPTSVQAAPSVARVAAAGAIPSFAPSSLLFAMFANPQQPPPLPPLPHQGPPAAFVAGAVIAAAVTVICIIAFAHHHPRTDAILAPGARIDLVLQAPLTLEADRVAAAAAISK